MLAAWRHGNDFCAPRRDGRAHFGRHVHGHQQPRRPDHDRTGGGADFTPTELLLVAVAGCTAIDVDILTSRRAEPDRFQVDAEADKMRRGRQPAHRHRGDVPADLPSGKAATPCG